MGPPVLDGIIEAWEWSGADVKDTFYLDVLNVDGNVDGDNRLYVGEDEDHLYVRLAHCIQPTEFYVPHRDPSRIIPIIYGLGNFSSIMSGPHEILNLIANFSVVKGSYKGRDKPRFSFVGRI